MTETIIFESAFTECYKSPGSLGSNIHATRRRFAVFAKKSENHEISLALILGSMPVYGKRGSARSYILYIKSIIST